VRKVAWIALLLGAGGGAAWLLWSPAKPREVDFARARREDLATTLVTNGRLEPLEFAVVKSDREGLASRVVVSKGQRVGAGQVVVEFATDELRGELAAAEARLAQVEAELPQFDRGGAPAALAEIDAAIGAARTRRDVSQREIDALERLVAKGAATRQELNEAKDRVAQATAEIAAAESKRKALLPPEGRAAAEARVREARAAMDLVRRKLDKTSLRSPLAGVAYNVVAKPGTFLHAGEVVAEIGRIDRLRAIVLIDEPELGRVSAGTPLKLSWDAMPNESWSAKVERMPTQVVAQGSRQVGEAVATVDNADRRLPPGANVNVEIQTGAVAGAITIPRAALQRQETGTGVWLLSGDTVAWRAVGVGVSTATHAQILHGLAEGDAVALPGETTIRGGDRVSPRFPR
jgi:multidrug efflux pump subunit AcrA (membrane-fusion protein)